MARSTYEELVAAQTSAPASSFVGKTSASETSSRGVDGMEVAKTLIRTVARAFYETKHILVVDALMIHSALAVEDLAHLLGQAQTKDTRKICGKLKEDRLLAVQSRPEGRVGMTRPVNRDYYYIDFHATIDAIKYRIYYLTEKVKELYKPVVEKKDYYCPKCKMQWTQLEVLSEKTGLMGFECHRCGGIIEREEAKEGDATGHEKQSRLMHQLDGMIKMLQQIDSQDIPKNDFDQAISLAVPIEREPSDKTANPLRPWHEIAETRASATAVHGVKTSFTPVDVSITTEADKTTGELAEAAKRKASEAEQNAVPIWYKTSAATGLPYSVSERPKETGAQPNGESLVKDDEDEKKDVNTMDDELEAYYKQLAQEKEKEAQLDRDADESSGDEEDDFENVEVGGSNAGTPASLNQIETDEPRTRQGSKPGESGSSGPATNASSPVNGDGPSFKKVKFEESSNGLTNGLLDANDANDKVSDEDEDVEFENV